MGYFAAGIIAGVVLTIVGIVGWIYWMEDERNVCHSDFIRKT